MMVQVKCANGGQLLYIANKVFVTTDMGGQNCHKNSKVEKKIPMMTGKMTLL